MSARTGPPRHEVRLESRLRLRNTLGTTVVLAHSTYAHYQYSCCRNAFSEAVLYPCGGGISVNELLSFPGPTAQAPALSISA
jgi:hypothetical protein